jgi:hypothetical protein
LLIIDFIRKNWDKLHVYIKCNFKFAELFKI